jgi:hypothetical protein
VKKSEPDFAIEWGRKEEEKRSDGGGGETKERKINMQIYSFNQNLNML